RSPGRVWVARTQPDMPPCTTTGWRYSLHRARIRETCSVVVGRINACASIRDMNTPGWREWTSAPSSRPAPSTMLRSCDSSCGSICRSPAGWAWIGSMMVASCAFIAWLFYQFFCLSPGLTTQHCGEPLSRFLIKGRWPAMAPQGERKHFVPKTGIPATRVTRGFGGWHGRPGAVLDSNGQRHGRRLQQRINLSSGATYEYAATASTDQRPAYPLRLRIG